MQTRWSPSPQEVPHDFCVLLRRARDADRGIMFNALLAAAAARRWRARSLASALDRPEAPVSAAAVSKRIERGRRAMRDRDPGWLEVADEVARIDIPEAPPARVVVKENTLPPAKIAELLEMQEVSSKVTGAMPADHPSRRVSERFSAELNRLVNEENIRPSYLARELGRSHRAIISRLERHHYRRPCPSVAGTPSGEYRNRKIGDPMQASPEP